MSTESPSPNRSTERVFPVDLLLPLLALSTAGLWTYLHTEAQFTGDGAAYALQAAEGSPWERSVHLGYLGPLWLWTRTLLSLGLSAERAVNLFSGAVLAAGLTVVFRASSMLLRAGGQEAGHQPTGPAVEESGRPDRLLPLAAAGSLLASAAVWEASLFSELYGLLSVLVLAATWAWAAGRARPGALLFAWAVLVHPGAVVFAPAAFIVSQSADRKRTAGWLVAAVVLVVTIHAAVPGEALSGPRGLTSLSSADRSPLQSLQALTRLIWHDWSLAAVPSLVGLGLATLQGPGSAGRRWVGALLWLIGSCAVGVDRFSDNSGQLPALWLGAAAAPLAFRALRDASTAGSKVALAALALLLSVGIAEATSQQDRHRREVERDLGELQAACGDLRERPPPKGPLGKRSAWALEQLQQLSCRDTAAP